METVHQQTERYKMVDSNQTEAHPHLSSTLPPGLQAGSDLVMSTYPQHQHIEPRLTSQPHMQPTYLSRRCMNTIPTKYATPVASVRLRFSDALFSANCNSLMSAAVIAARRRSAGTSLSNNTGTKSSGLNSGGVTDPDSSCSARIAHMTLM